MSEAGCEGRAENVVMDVEWTELGVKWTEMDGFWLEMDGF